MKQTKQVQVMLTALFTLALMLGSLSFVMAEDTSNDSSSAIALYNDTSNLSEGIVIAPAPGIVDDFNETSSGRIGWEQLKIWLTFNQEKKAEMELKLADMRLNQARHAAKNNNTEAMEKAMEAHDRIIQRIQDRVQRMESSNDENSTKEKIGGLYGLKNAIETHENRIAKLNAILQNENLTEQQRKVVEMRLEKAQNNTAHLQEVQADKEDKLKTKLMAVANLTEEQAQLVIDTIHDSKDKEEFKNNMHEIKDQIKEQKEQQKEANKKAKQAQKDSNESGQSNSSEDNLEDSSDIDLESNESD